MSTGSSGIRLLQLVFYRLWMSCLFFFFIAAACDKAGDSVSLWPRIEHAVMTGRPGHSSGPRRFDSTHHLRIAFTLVAVSMVISQTGLWELQLFSWRALHPPCCSTHLQACGGSGRQWQHRVCWFTEKGSNKAVTVMYVADMWLIAVFPHWREPTWDYCIYGGGAHSSPLLSHTHG